MTTNEIPYVRVLGEKGSLCVMGGGERVSIHSRPHRMQEEGSSASLKESCHAYEVQRGAV